VDDRQARRAYAFYAPMYDRLFGGVFQKGRVATIRQLAPRPGERVLEVGVGTGLMLPLYPAHCRVVGVDFSAEMLERAADRVSRHGMSHIELQRMDAANMQFDDGSFDAVVAAYVVTAVPDYRAVLREIERICRPGGRVILTNHFSNGNRLLGALERVSSPIFEYAGFRTDLKVADVVDGTSLELRSAQRLNGLWQVVELVKAGTGPAGGNGRARRPD
jgi:phosphatidylethanolamine/phosphatidyl-N-methylethanolamine N-methyltransferase